jgi:hypothetical protein
MLKVWLDESQKAGPYMHGHGEQSSSSALVEEEQFEGQTLEISDSDESDKSK